jgi:hypothetical protein
VTFIGRPPRGRREAIREQQYSNPLARFRMTIDLVQEKRCGTPASVPTGKEYVSAAMECHMDARTVSSPVSCDQSNWKRSK